MLILVTIGENKMHYVCLLYVFGNFFSSSVILIVFCFNSFALCPNIDRKFKVFSSKKYNFNTKCKNSCLP